MNELTVVGQSPLALSQHGRDVAEVCRDIVTDTAVTIEGKRYVRVEGWQSIAAAWGHTPEVVGLTQTERGVRAEAILKRDSDGAIMSRAFGFVGFDEYEGTDKRGKPLEKPKDYAIEGKAQTRAVSRVCRHKFAFVVTLIDKGLSTTPAEEVPREGFQDHWGGSPAPKQSKGKTVQEIEGKLTGVGFANGWWNAFIKGIKFGTNDKEFEKVLWQCNDTEVIATLETKTTKEGKPWFKLVKLVPASMNQELDIKPEDESQETYEPGSEG